MLIYYIFMLVCPYFTTVNLGMDYLFSQEQIDTPIVTIDCL